MGFFSRSDTAAATPIKFEMSLPSPRPTSYPHLNLTVYQHMPTFIVAEISFTIIALLALRHAWTRPTNHPSGRRRHILLYIFAIVGGCCSDLLFMHLPIVDNFWHAQGTVMLTERLPLYILFVYASFLYVPIACSWRLGLPKVAEATLAGLAAIFFYAPFDVVGQKFLWWTWHDSDTVSLLMFSFFLFSFFFFLFLLLLFVTLLP